MLKPLKRFRMSNSLAALTEWKALITHQKALRNVHMRDLFADDKERFEGFHTEIKGFLFDYSRHRITRKTLQLLIDLARAREVETWRTRMFSGDKINLTENRAVLHAALRGSTDAGLIVDGENVKDFVDATLFQ